MSRIISRAKPRVHTEAPKRVYTEDISAAAGPRVLPFRPPPIPVTWFARLVNGLAERDQPAVDEARRELRSRGFDVRPIGTPKRKGGPARCHS